MAQERRSLPASLGVLVVLLVGGSQASLAGSPGSPAIDHLLEPESVVPVTSAEFEAILEHHRGNAVIVNFWATWCAPCLKELPDLDRLQQEYHDQGLKVIAVSIDRPKTLEKMVQPYSAKHAPNLVSYLAVGEKKSVSRIGSFRAARKLVHTIYSEWDGKVPATVVLDAGGARLTAFTGSRTYSEFKTFVQEHLEALPKGNPR